LLDARFPVYATGRGGQFTYHGPGQRIGYVMLDLKRRAPDVRRFVASIEEWIIRTHAASGARMASAFGSGAGTRGEGSEDKIAAIGIRIQRWVTLHGFALNVAPNLAHFSGIVPCGVSGQPSANAPRAPPVRCRARTSRNNGAFGLQEWPQSG
jgi:lipoyl(octanoyl) transferase